MSGEDIFSRWSKRRRAVAQEQAEAPAVVPEAPVVEDAVAEAEERTDAEILEALGLRDPDELVKGDDFSAYLAKAVPEHLRRRALRRLWRSDPRLAVLDGLNDYDGDYTGGGVPKGTLKTAYRVGEGLVRKVVEIAGDEEAEKPAPVSVRPPDPVATLEELPREVAEAPEDCAEDAVDPAEGPQEAWNDADDDTPAPSRRRMVFRSGPDDDTLI